MKIRLQRYDQATLYIHLNTPEASRSFLLDGTKPIGAAIRERAAHYRDQAERMNRYASLLEQAELLV